MLGSCGQHTQDPARLASSFGAHHGAHSLVVPRYQPFPSQAPSPLEPLSYTQPSTMLRVVAPGGAHSGGSSSRQWQAAGGS